MSFLNLFGDGDKSSSSSSTTQTTNNINPLTYAGSQGVSTSSVMTGNGTINNTISNTTLDGDVAIHAMDNMLTSNQDSLLFAADAQKQAYNFSSGVNNQAFSFASAANQAANATSTAAIGSASSSMDKALSFGAKQTSVALDALAGSANMIKDSYADAKGRGALTDWMLMGAIGVAGLIAVVAVWKK